MERAVVYGIRTGPALTRVTVSYAPPRAGVAARIFRTVAGTVAELGTVALHVPAGTRRADLWFTVAERDGPAAAAALREVRHEIGCHAVLLEPVVAVALVGAGFRTDPAAPATFCEALVMAGVPLGPVSVDGHRLSVLCTRSRLAAAVRALREAFEVRLAVPCDRPLGPEHENAGGVR